MIFTFTDGIPLERPAPFNNLDIIKTCEATQKKFWARVSKEYHPKDCWMWKGGCNDEGYGNFRVGKKSERAHRASYRLNNGRIPIGLCVCHSCDNPSCVNPQHLWLGTDQDNTDDKLRKGRLNPAFGDKNGSRTHPERLKRGDENVSRKNPELLVRGADHWTAKRPEDVVKGEAVHTAKITEAEAVGIRKMYSEISDIEAVAARFSVPRELAYNVIVGNTWKHLPGAIDSVPCDNKNRRRGENVNTAKITAEQVKEIRTAYAADPLVAANRRSRVSYALAEKYGVSRGMIVRIVSRLCWAHVP